MRTSFVRACTEPAPRGFVDRRISLLHLRGVAWARVGEFVGQRNLAVTATTYSHVLLDETEVDYAALLTERPRRAENSQIRARLCCPGAVPGSRRTWQRGAVTVVAPPDGDLLPDNDPDWRVECTLRAPLTGPGYAGGASPTVGAYGGDASETTLPIVFAGNLPNGGPLGLTCLRGAGSGAAGTGSSNPKVVYVEVSAIRAGSLG